MKTITRKYLVINGQRCYFFYPVSITFFKNDDRSVTCKIENLLSEKGRSQKEAYKNAKATLSRYLKLSRKPAYLCSEEEIKIRGKIFGMVDPVLSQPPSKRKKFKFLAGELIEKGSQFFFQPLSADYGQQQISKKLAQKAQALDEFFIAKFRADRYENPIGRPIDVQPLFPEKTKIIGY